MENSEIKTETFVGKLEKEYCQKYCHGKKQTKKKTIEIAPTVVNYRMASI